jgi:peptide methionine sulfoxide reductase MsrA
MAMLLHDIHVRTEGATFAMACFKACDALFGIQKGVIRTRVGYVRERTVKALDEYL